MNKKTMTIVNVLTTDKQKDVCKTDDPSQQGSVALGYSICPLQLQVHVR